MLNILDEVVTFGKFKGRLWREIDMSYLNWILEKGNNEDIRKIAFKVIAERHEEYAEFEKKNNPSITFSDKGSEDKITNEVLFEKLRTSIDELEKAEAASKNTQLSLINKIKDHLLEYKSINALDDQYPTIIVEFHDS